MVSILRCSTSNILHMQTNDLDLLIVAHYLHQCTGIPHFTALRFLHLADFYKLHFFANKRFVETALSKSYQHYFSNSVYSMSLTFW